MGHNRISSMTDSADHNLSISSAENVIFTMENCLTCDWVSEVELLRLKTAIERLSLKPEMIKAKRVVEEHQYNDGIITEFMVRSGWSSADQFQLFPIVMLKTLTF